MDPVAFLGTSGSTNRNWGHGFPFEVASLLLLAITTYAAASTATASMLGWSAQAFTSSLTQDVYYGRRIASTGRRGARSPRVRHRFPTTNAPEDEGQALRLIPVP
jgi:hypothetical protein